MAMINCPSCGNPISDKATECIHCGHVLNSPAQKVCPECGAVLEKELLVCNKCGCPLHDDSEKKDVITHSSEASQVKSKKRFGWKIVLVLILVALILVGALFGLKIFLDKKESERIENYKSDLTSVVYSMLSGGTTTEDCGRLIRQVWYNSIYEERDSSTDKYTLNSYGAFYDDFNDALGNLFSDPTFSSDISKIEKNQTEVSDGMKELVDPPESQREAYTALQEVYSAYLEFTNHIVNPSGNYSSFSSTFDSLLNKFANTVSKMRIYIN